MNIDELINSYVVEDDTVAQSQIAQKLAGSFKLLQIVLGLEDPLTQEDGLVRAKATKCLVDVLPHFNSLNLQELKVLFFFLSDRLSDLQSVADAAAGLSTLIQNNKSARLLDNVFWPKLKAADMLKLDLESRNAVYQLLRVILSVDASDNFVSTFVALAGGEKDPRNLILNLGMSRDILTERGFTLDSSRRAEIYDITFCYFPVKFHPPKDMPYKITAEEIKNELTRTLSRPELAEWVIPALIGKLNAVNVIVKLDSLATMDAALDNIAKNGNLSDYWTQIWDGLIFEVLHGTPENDTYQPAIKILAKFIEIPEFIQAVQREFEPENIAKSKLYQLAQLAVGLAASEKVWHEIAPAAVLKSLEHPAVLNILLAAKHPIPHSDQVFQALMQEIASDHKKEGILGLKNLINNENGSDFVPLVIQTLTQEKAYSDLAELSASHPNAIRDYALPLICNDIPASLDALSEICRVRPLVQYLSLRLISRLELTDIDHSLKLLNTLISASGHLANTADFIGFDRMWVKPLLEMASRTEYHELADILVDRMCILLERASRGVSQQDQSSYYQMVMQFCAKVPFHLIVSSLCAMSEFPSAVDCVNNAVDHDLKQAKSVLERAAHLRLIALAVNKRWITETVVGEDGLRNSQGAVDCSKAEVFAWETKGLILRNEATGFTRAMALCKLAFLDLRIANLFGIVVADDRLLVKANGCTVRALFKQRLFTMILPKIIESPPTTETLIILSALLKYTPQSVVAPQFAGILTMVMSSLESDIALLQETAVESILISLPSSAVTLEPHLYAMVPRLIDIAITPASTAPARLNSLKTIGKLIDSLPKEMESFRDLAIDGLVPALGDLKRNVRREAVRCRQKFYQ